MQNLIDACTSCGTFQRIPVEDLWLEGVNEIICEHCLKEMLDNDDSNDIIEGSYD